VVREGIEEKIISKITSSLFVSRDARAERSSVARHPDDSGRSTRSAVETFRQQVRQRRPPAGPSIAPEKLLRVAGAQGEGPFCRLYIPPRQTVWGVFRTEGKMLHPSPYRRTGFDVDSGPPARPREGLAALRGKDMELALEGRAWGDGVWELYGVRSISDSAPENSLIASSKSFKIAFINA
jgi:hypothetical protein